MKRCLSCAQGFVADSWSCPKCHSTAATVNGFTSFAPDLAFENDGMSGASMPVLDAIQHSSFWFRARNRLILDLARRFAPNARTIMEIGCGTGYVLNGLSHAFPFSHLTGSEIHVSALPFARRRVGSDATLLQMDARRVPYEAEFDLIGAFDVLEHIEEDMDVIAEMKRALRPDGHLILSVPQHPMLWSATDVSALHKRRYRRNELASKLRASGLEVILDTSFVFSLLPAMLGQRLLKGQSESYDPGSEFRLPHWLDRSFELLLDGERRLISTGFRFPVGGSRIAVARRITL